MAASPTTVELDVSGLAPDLITIDALARLQVSARRHGRRLRLRKASQDLLDLVALVGLSEVLGVELQRQPEEREQRGGIEEERELDDPAV